MNPLRIFLVDDNPIFLNSAATFLSAQPHIKIVGLAHSAIQALEQLPYLIPDVVLMDISMPGMNGLKAITRIKRQNLARRVILVTIHDDCEHRLSAAEAGADGYIVKDNFLDSIESLLGLPAIAATLN